MGASELVYYHIRIRVMGGAQLAIFYTTSVKRITSLESTGKPY